MNGCKDAVKHARHHGGCRVVLLRHGQSRWNRDLRFTGWSDVDLTREGERQMRVAAGALHQSGIEVDTAFTSVLSRCIRSTWIVLDTLGCLWLPQVLDWRLNERHYGGLTGLSRTEAETRFGADAVQRWRRSYDAVPPPADERSERYVRIDRRYAEVDPARLPLSESLADTVRRVDSVWQERIAPLVLGGQRVLIVGHGNALRALTKLLEGISDSAIMQLEIPNGVPVVYDFDTHLHVTSKKLLPAGSWTSAEIL